MGTWFIKRLSGPLYTNYRPQPIRTKKGTEISFKTVTSEKPIKATPHKQAVDAALHVLAERK